jgi:hypothetical protein
MTKRNVAGALAEIDKRLDTAILDEETRAAIKAKAREHVDKKRRDEAEARLLALEIRKAEIEDRPTEQDEDVLIDIPPFVAAEKLGGSCITIDGKMFFHGVTYTVPYSVARVLEDVMARSWEHEREINGKRRKADVNRRPVYQADPAKARVMPGMEGTPSAVNTRQSVLDSNQAI